MNHPPEIGRQRRRLSAPSLVLLGLAAIQVVAMPAGCVEAPVVDQARFGNVFLEGDLVQLPVQSDADRIAWRVTDFFGAEVARGTALVVRGRAMIEPAFDRSGYFELHLAPTSGDGGEAVSSFAVVPPPDPSVPASASPFGVMTHFAQGWDTDLIPLIARAGLRHIRDEQYWSEVEPEPGRFVFPQGFTDYMAKARANGLEPLIIMSFENPNYDGGQTPYTEAGRAGYARYGQALLERYGAQIGALEVWNEYNGSFVHGPAEDDRPRAYALMLKQAYRAIKQARPEVTVLGGAAVTVPLPWLEAVFQAGGLEAMDGVVVHPYRERPEGVERDIRDLRALIEAHNGGAPKPIWVTEFGRTAEGETGRRQNAAYLVRIGTLMLSAGVERMYWYLMRDYADFETMGLVRDADSPFGRYAPAPAYVAYAVLIHELEGATYIRREDTDPRSQVHLFEKDGQEIRVAWSTSDAPRLELETDAPLALVDIMGGERSLRPSAGSVSLALTETPVYIRGPVRAVREWRPDVLIADSISDFSDRDADGAWRYGYADGDGEGTGDGADPKGPYSDDDFEPLQPVSDLWGRSWGAQGLGPLRVDREGAHPGLAGDRPVWAVRRWRSPVAGTVRIAGEVGSADRGGDGTEVRILRDGAPIFARVLEGQSGAAPSTYAVTAEVAEGSALDFVVTPGPGRDVDFDATAFSASVSLPLLADSVRDFGRVQGANGWSYGRYDGDDAFEPLASAPGGADQGWSDAAFGPLMINRAGAHPAVRDGRSVWAVRRWQSEAEGVVRITGRIAVWQNDGDGTRARILIDGQTVFEADAGGPDRPDQLGYDITAAVREGSVVDFALGPGPGTDIDFDGTQFTAVIEGLSGQGADRAAGAASLPDPAAPLR